MRVKCFRVEMIKPRVDAWEGHIGKPRYRRLDTGEELRGDLPAGALYIAVPAHQYNYSRGHDGEAVVCVLPGGDHWHIDSFVNNCTMPDDKEHRCWVRHGSKPGTIHVDKNGLPCAAGRLNRHEEIPTFCTARSTAARRLRPAGRLHLMGEVDLDGRDENGDCETGQRKSRPPLSVSLLR